MYKIVERCRANIILQRKKSVLMFMKAAMYSTKNLIVPTAYNIGHGVGGWLYYMIKYYFMQQQIN